MNVFRQGMAALVPTPVGSDAATGENQSGFSR
jgi:hypothetical protein